MEGCWDGRTDPNCRIYFLFKNVMTLNYYTCEKAFKRLLYFFLFTKIMLADFFQKNLTDFFSRNLRLSYEAFGILTHKKLRLILRQFIIVIWRNHVTFILRELSHAKMPNIS